MTCTTRSWVLASRYWSSSSGLSVRDSRRVLIGVGVEREEVEGVPDGIEDPARRLGDPAGLAVDPEVQAAQDGRTHQVPAQGVAAHLAEHDVGFGVVAQPLRQLATVLGQQRAVADDVGERRPIEQRHPQHVHGVEPAARLRDVLDDEVGRVVLVEPFGVLEGVVHAGEG